MVSFCQVHKDDFLETTKAVAVAVWDPSARDKCNYTALISLRNKQIVRKIQSSSEILRLCPIYDGIEMPKEKLKLQKTFHENWPHMMLVGCRAGIATLTHFSVENDDIDENSGVIVKPKRSINLSQLFTNMREGKTRL